MNIKNAINALTGWTKSKLPCFSRSAPAPRLDIDSMTPEEIRKNAYQLLVQPQAEIDKKSAAAELKALEKMGMWLGADDLDCLFGLVFVHAEHDLESANGGDPFGSRWKEAKSTKRMWMERAEETGYQQAHGRTHRGRVDGMSRRISA